jgi:hypothetical protein
LQNAHLALGTATYSERCAVASGVRSLYCEGVSEFEQRAINLYVFLNSLLDRSMSLDRIPAA